MSQSFLLFLGAVTLALLFSGAGFCWAAARGQFRRLREGASVILDETDLSPAGQSSHRI